MKNTQCARLYLGAVGAMLALSLSTAAGAQNLTTGSVVHANAALPPHPPSAPLSAWTAAAGRTPLTFAASGATLRGYLYAPPHETNLTILFFNGSGNTVLAEDAHYRALAEQGATVEVLDYRGGGYSTGTADMEAFARDGIALYDQRAAHGPVVVYGYSLGTAIAVAVASERSVPALVLAAPIASAEEELRDVLTESHISPAEIRQLTIAPDAHAAFDEAAHVAHITAPLLVIHGTADTNVPIAQGREVYNASPTAKKHFVELAGYGHGGITTAPPALTALRELLSAL